MATSDAVNIAFAMTLKLKFAIAGECERPFTVCSERL